MSLQFPIPQFPGQVIRYQGKSWIWDGVAWHIDTGVASRIDLAMVPAYLGQYVYIMPGTPPLPTFISLSDPDIFGATYILENDGPLEGVQVYINGILQIRDDGSGTLGSYAVNTVANRIEFLTPRATGDKITIGILTPPDAIAPGRADVEPIKDLDTDWVTDPMVPVSGMVDGVRTTFDLLVDVAGVGQEYAVISRATDLAVFVGGVRKRAGIDYLVTGSVLTMIAPPQVGVPFWALWYKPAGLDLAAEIDPPPPPLDDKLSVYGWRPGTGVGWQDARGLATTVADAAARTALSSVDLMPGRLVLQADTQDLWRWTGSVWVRYLDAGTFAAPLGGRAQILRSSTALARPAADAGLAGQLWINTTDRFMGFFDDGGDPVDLLDVTLQAFGASGTGAIVLTDWNDAHLNGTAFVRAGATATNRPADARYAGTYTKVDANAGVLIVSSPDNGVVYIRARTAGVWGTWFNITEEAIIPDGLLQSNNLNDILDFPLARANLEVLRSVLTPYTGDLNALDEGGLYQLGVGVTNGWGEDDTGTGGDATVGDAVLHVKTGGGLAYQLGLNVIPDAPAAKPLRLRFKTGVSTWTPWTSIGTSAEVTAEINAAIAALPPGTHVGSTAPVSPEQGQLWYRTIAPVGLFIWYEDGSSNQWVETGGGGNAVPGSPLDFPSGPTVNQVYSAAGVRYVWTGDVWRLDTAGIVPTGGIIMWSGSVVSIPGGWALCDGSNGTPDLRGRFIVGAGGAYSPGNTGGAETVTLDATQIPSHTHSVNLTTSSDGSHTHGYFQAPTWAVAYSSGTITRAYLGSGTTPPTRSTDAAGVHSHSVNGNTGSAGSGAAHENRPPYYALAYIMRL